MNIAIKESIASFVNSERKPGDPGKRWRRLRQGQSLLLLLAGQAHMGAASALACAAWQRLAQGGRRPKLRGISDPLSFFFCG